MKLLLSFRCFCDLSLFSYRKTPLAVCSEVEIEAQDYFEIKVRVACSVITGVEESAKESLSQAFKNSFVNVLAYEINNEMKIDESLVKKLSS